MSALAVPLCAQVTQRVSVDSAGAQANGHSYVPRFSADGRFVAFIGDATNLVAGDTNALQDVFVRDRQLGTTARVNVSSTGVEATGLSGGGYGAVLTADGRFVAFQSDATNLVAGDTNGASDVFVRDLQLGATERVSVGPGAGQGDQESGYGGISISADGRFVAFASHATSFDLGDTNGASDVYLRDRTLGATVRVSIGVADSQGDLDSWRPSLSADARYVAFQSDASNLVGGDSNAQTDVFVRDRQLATIVRASVGASGQGNSYSYSPAISANGRFVVFDSVATNLVAGDTNLRADVFVRDLQLGGIQRVSVSSAGAEADGNSDGGYGASISDDGRFVAFQSNASNLVAGDTNALTDSFVRDRQRGTTERVSLDTAGSQSNGSSAMPVLSADGRFVAFHSGATNLVPADTNGFHDVFVRDRGPIVGGAYCTAGSTTNGCSATISGAGTPSASAGAGFTLSASSLEGQRPGLFFYGLDNSGFAPLPWGASSSWLCVKSPTQRTPVQSSGGASGACDGSFALDWNAYVAANASALGNPFAAGQHVFAQAWFRDPPAPKTTSLSDALEFVVGP